MVVIALMLAAALGAGPQDAVVATAPATSVDLTATERPPAPPMTGATQEAVGHGLTTDAQIDRWITARTPADRPWSAAAEGPSDDRKVHGAITLGVGTGGFRDYGAAVSLPLGESGRLDVTYRQVENGYGYGYGGYGYGGPGYEPIFLDDAAYSGSRSGLGAFDTRSRRNGRDASNRSAAD